MLTDCTSTWEKGRMNHWNMPPQCLHTYSRPALDGCVKPFWCQMYPAAGCLLAWALGYTLRDLGVRIVLCGSIRSCHML